MLTDLFGEEFLVDLFGDEFLVDLFGDEFLLVDLSIEDFIDLRDDDFFSCFSGEIFIKDFLED